MKPPLTGPGEEMVNAMKAPPHAGPSRAGGEAFMVHIVYIAH